MPWRLQNLEYRDAGICVPWGWMGTEERILGPGVTPQSLLVGQKNIPQYSGYGHLAGYMIVEPRIGQYPLGIKVAYRL